MSAQFSRVSVMTPSALVPALSSSCAPALSSTPVRRKVSAAGIHRSARAASSDIGAASAAGHIRWRASALSRDGFAPLRVCPALIAGHDDAAGIAREERASARPRRRGAHRGRAASSRTPAGVIATAAIQAATVGIVFVGSASMPSAQLVAELDERRWPPEVERKRLVVHGDLIDGGRGREGLGCLRRRAG